MNQSAATPNSIASPKALAISVLCLSQLLSGCQSLQMFQQTEPETIVWNSRTESIPVHEFSLSPGQNLIGELASITSAENDTLSDIGRHYGLGFNDIANANADVDPWTLTAGQNVLLPLSFILPEAPHKGIVLNLANMRMFYYPKNSASTVLTYPVGIGRQGWNTPLGQTQIVAKKANPAWTVPVSIQQEHQALGDPLPKIVQSGPENPLGDYAMPLGFSGYLIHGTNKPYGIGMKVSHGCVQLYPEDIETLFSKVEIGTPVNIVHQPYLAAWRDDMLYLEAHPPLDKWDKQTKLLQKDIRKKLQQLASAKGAEVDWNKAERILQRADGIATPVLIGSPDLAELRANAIPLSRPEKLFGQPIPSELSDSDWAIQAAVFDNETDAQKLAAMLNHQGPPIPARKVAKDGNYQVVVGPL